MGCNAIGVINANGIVVANSSLSGNPHLDVSDRIYFQKVKSTHKPFISPAVITRLPGNPILSHIARLVFNASGILIAIILVGMETEKLAENCSMINVDLKPAVAIMKSDGGLLASYPDMAKHVGKNVLHAAPFKKDTPRSSSGVVDLAETLDVVPRLVGYEKISELGLFVTVGIQYDVAFRDWKLRAYNKQLLPFGNY